MVNKPKILVIVGPTASGKTSLSIRLAQKFNGEIISADSRQVYRGLDIGTSKVTKEEMLNIPHHLLDVADPEDTYTVTDFVHDGHTAITDITSREKLPIVVGGTFFYVDALLGRVSSPEVVPNPKLREKLEALSNEKLFSLLSEKDPVRGETIDAGNKRRLVRALEIVEALGVVPEIKKEELYDPLILGISISKEDLKKNIHDRLIARLETGMIDEVKNLRANGLHYTTLREKGIEYEYIIEYLEGKISKDEMRLQIETKSLQYAKRQMTWLKRDKCIVWVDPKDADRVEKIVEEFLK